MTGRNRPGAVAKIVTTLNQAMIAHQHGTLDDAEKLYQTVLDIDPRQFDALHMLGILKAQRGNFEDGRKLLLKALKSNPQAADAHCNLGRVLRSLGHREQALESIERALVINPTLVAALSNRALLLRESGRREEAMATYDRALSLAPTNLDIMFNRGSLLLDLRRPAEALDVFDAVLSRSAGYADARIERANALHDMQRYREALAELDGILAADPRNTLALYNRGNLLKILDRPDEAIEAYNAAIATRPNYADAYHNRGNLLMMQRSYRHAAADFAMALRFDPGCKYALGNFIQCRMQTCDWTGLDEARVALTEGIRADRPVATPFMLLGVNPSPADQLACSRRFVADKYPPAAIAAMRREHHHDKIRVAYVSGDLRDHAVAFLIAGLFEKHDRTRFETTAISLVSEHPSAILNRIKAAFDRFVTVVGKTDAEVIALMRELEIDIAVDLSGHTGNARTGIFAGRAAPIQLNYLGYPGTMGADYIDYIVADRFVVPPEAEKYYLEKIVYLPDTFQVNDSARAIPTDGPSRAGVGLPELGIVFCAFNAAHKLTPEMFDAWMRVLRQVERSVLWLVSDDAGVIANLKQRAESNGIGSQRLVFGPYVEYTEHLARLRLADLFLDTFPFGGGTTTSDALWMGVPVLTLAGAPFAARMSGSLLSVVGLTELIVHSLADYEALAVTLGRDPGLLEKTKAKLAHSRTTSPLFDTARFARHLEAAYQEMWRRNRSGVAPESFSVDSIASIA